jgi:hypothetical protein
LDDDLNIDSGEFRLNGALPQKGFFSFTRIDEGIYRWGLSRAFEPNTDYEVYFEIYDRAGQKSSGKIWFDTFAATNAVIEIEDYNFAGQFIDRPLVWPLGSSYPNAYNLREGVPEIDFYELSPLVWQTNVYRPSDAVGLVFSLDYRRASYSDEQGQEIPGISDVDLAGIRKGEWLNYTRHFPTGICQVYLKWFLKTDRSRARLEKVSGDTRTTNQTTWPAGVFVGTATGPIYRNVPLTDATGERTLPIRVGGLETWRLVHEVEDATGESLLENYLVFVPVAGVLRLRPALTQVVPLPNEELDGIYPVVRAVLEGRDTGLDTNSIRLELEGQPVTAAIGVVGDYTIVSYAPELPGDSTDIDAIISFQDGEGIFQTNHWSFSVRNPELALHLQSAERVDGVYKLVSPIRRDLANQTLEAPLPTDTHFYRIQLAATAQCAIKILSVRIEGRALLFRYGI